MSSLSILGFGILMGMTIAFVGVLLVNLGIPYSIVIGSISGGLSMLYTLEYHKLLSNSGHNDDGVDE